MHLLRRMSGMEKMIESSTVASFIFIKRARANSIRSTYRFNVFLSKHKMKILIYSLSGYRSFFRLHPSLFRCFLSAKQIIILTMSFLPLVNRVDYHWHYTVLHAIMLIHSQTRHDATQNIINFTEYTLYGPFGVLANKSLEKLLMASLEWKSNSQQ